MRAWCPRCDAVRPGETTCPVCGTPLATLQEPQPAPAPDAPPPDEPAPPPSAPSRLRVALLVTVVVLGGLAFVAGRSGARPAPAAPATTTPPTTTAPAAGDDLRELGWRARARGLTVTAVSIRRIVTPDRETSAALTLRVEGLPPGQRVFALHELRLLDLGGGVFSAPEEEPVGDQLGTPVTPTQDPATYEVLTAPAPRLQSLAGIEVGSLIVVRPRTATIGLDVGAPWPARPPLRAVDPGSRDEVTVTVPAGSANAGEDIRLPVRLAAVLVGGGRAVVALDARAIEDEFQAIPGGSLPLSAELRAGDRVLCSRTVLLRSGDIRTMFGMVLACRTRPVPRLEVAVGAGVRALRVGATMKP
jgi:hypothetical protein